MKMWTSNAEWPREVFYDRITTDAHYSKAQAEAVCKNLERLGFGGDRQHFPIRTWVEEVPERNPQP